MEYITLLQGQPDRTCYWLPSASFLATYSCRSRSLYQCVQMSSIADQNSLTDFLTMQKRLHVAIPSPNQKHHDFSTQCGREHGGIRGSSTAQHIRLPSTTPCCPKQSYRICRQACQGHTA